MTLELVPGALVSPKTQQLFEYQCEPSLCMEVFEQCPKAQAGVEYRVTLHGRSEREVIVRCVTLKGGLVQVLAVNASSECTAIFVPQNLSHL